jgi:hypothetical protein
MPARHQPTDNRQQQRDIAPALEHRDEKAKPAHGNSTFALES